MAGLQREEGARYTKNKSKFKKNKSLEQLGHGLFSVASVDNCTNHFTCTRFVYLLYY